MKEKSLKDRVIYYDYLRVWATIAVMMIHVSASNWYGADINGNDWKIFNFYGGIVRWAVPVFVMISGALFLGQEEISIKQIYKKYVPRMIVAYFAWSFIYYLFEGEAVIQQFVSLFRPGKTERIISIMKGHYHLWFILMIAGIYICLPIIKQIVKNEKVSSYFLIISFVFWFLIPEYVTIVNDFGGEKFVEITNVIYGRIDALSLGFIKNYVFYFILGYKLSRVVFEKKTKIWIYILGIIGFAFTVIMDYVVSVKAQGLRQTYYDNNCVNVLLEAVFVFELFKNIPFKKNGFYKVVVYLSKWSFGAYLVHDLVLSRLKIKGIHTLSFNPILATPVMVGLVFVISFSISAIINLIPGVRKYCA